MEIILMIFLTAFLSMAIYLLWILIKWLKKEIEE